MWSGVSLWFWFVISWLLMMLSIFFYAHWPFVYHLGRYMYQNLWPFLKWDYLSFYYRVLRGFDIFWIQIPHWVYDLPFLFSHSMSYLFAFLIESWEEQKFFILMKTNLSFFFLLLLVFWVFYLRNCYLTQGHEDLFLYFLLRFFFK